MSNSCPFCPKPCNEPHCSYTEPKIEKYWEYAPDHFLLREALPSDDPENLYNWFVRNYPNLKPKDYKIKK